MRRPWPPCTRRSIQSCRHEQTLPDDQAAWRPTSSLSSWSQGAMSLVCRLCNEGFLDASRALGLKERPPLKIDKRFCGSNSLLPLTNCLLFEIFSLLICVGNCAKSRCGTAASCSKIVSGSLGIAIFPVKFPVSREFGWRRVRSALRRQPTSHSARDCGL